MRTQKAANEANSADLLNTFDLKPLFKISVCSLSGLFHALDSDTTQGITGDSEIDTLSRPVKCWGIRECVWNAESSRSLAWKRIDYFSILTEPVWKYSQYT